MVLALFAVGLAGSASGVAAGAGAPHGGSAAASSGLTEFEETLVGCVGEGPDCIDEQVGELIEACPNQTCRQAVATRLEREASTAIAELRRELPDVLGRMQRTDRWLDARDRFASCAAEIGVGRGLDDGQLADPSAVRRAVVDEASALYRQATRSSNRPGEFDSVSTENPPGVPPLDALPPVVETVDLEAILAIDASIEESLRAVDSCERDAGLIDIERDMIAQALSGGR